MTDYTDHVRQLERLLKESDQANAEMRAAGIEHAQADSQYRGAKQKSRLLHTTAPVAEGQKALTIPTVDALVDRDCAAERDRQRLAKAKYECAIEYVRSLRTNISAIQTLLNHSKAEMEMTRHQ